MIILSLVKTNYYNNMLIGDNFLNNDNKETVGILGIALALICVALLLKDNKDLGWLRMILRVLALFLLCMSFVPNKLHQFISKFKK